MPPSDTTNPVPVSEHIWTARLVGKTKVMCGKQNTDGSYRCGEQFGTISVSDKGARVFGFNSGWIPDRDTGVWMLTSRSEKRLKRGMSSRDRRPAIKDESGALDVVHTPALPVYARCKCGATNRLDHRLLKVSREPTFDVDVRMV